MSIAIEYANDDDEPVITFTEAEQLNWPRADEVLNVLISAARQCFRFLHPTKSGMSERECWSHYARSNYCAFLVVQWIECVGDWELADLYSKSDIRYLENTLPALLAAYERCNTIWTDTDIDYVIEAHAILDEIGDKMYPGCFDQEVYRELNDFFADILPGAGCA